jgi:hypothetical protein
MLGLLHLPGPHKKKFKVSCNFVRCTCNVRAMAHIPDSRLLSVAKEDLIFATEEYAHLKECPECFNKWAAFVKSTDAQEEGTK